MEQITNNGLTLTNWITIVSVFVLITGWFINSYLRRKQDTSKEKLKYRMEALYFCVEFILFIEDRNFLFNDKEFSSKLKKAKQYLFFFGNTDEFHALNSLEEKIYSSQNDIENELHAFKQALRISIKSTLKLQ